MQQDIHKLVGEIHATKQPLVISCAGGGAEAIGMLTSVPGASQVLLDASVPYSEPALHELLGGPVDQACSATTSRQMAMAAWQRSAHLVGEARAGLVGIGATASLVSQRPKRGEHRVFASWQTETTTGTFSLHLSKGTRSREEEEHLAARLILTAICRAVSLQLPLLEITDEDRLEADEWQAQGTWSNMLLGDVEWSPADSQTDVDAVCALVPGSFNPPHHAHRTIFELASEHIGGHAHYELSMTNVDKPPLDFEQLHSRTAQLDSERLIYTRAATFIEKARLFPGVTFAVGADTMLRIGQPRYYAGGEVGMNAAIAELADHGVRFLVFGRVVGDAFLGLDDLSMPPALRDICEGVAEQQFRHDISSTQLRQGK